MRGRKHKEDKVTVEEEEASEVEGLLHNLTIKAAVTEDEAAEEIV